MEELFKKLLEAAEEDQKQVHVNAAYESITNIALDLTLLVIYIKKYQVMVPENIKNLDKITKAFLTELHDIIKAEVDIDTLRHLG